MLIFFEFFFVLWLSFFSRKIKLNCRVILFRCSHFWEQPFLPQQEKKKSKKKPHTQDKKDDDDAFYQILILQKTEKKKN